jgi:hypothetical protein
VTTPVAGARRHSVLAVLSLILALLAALPLCALLLYAGTATPLGKNSLVPLALTLGLFASIGLQLLAGGLGIGALFVEDRKRVCAIVALTMNAMTIGATLILLVRAASD